MGGRKHVSYKYVASLNIISQAVVFTVRMWNGTGGFASLVFGLLMTFWGLSDTCSGLAFFRLYTGF